jgi:hypothetical protein
MFLDIEVPKNYQNDGWDKLFNSIFDGKNVYMDTVQKKIVSIFNSYRIILEQNLTVLDGKVLRMSKDRIRVKNSKYDNGVVINSSAIVNSLMFKYEYSINKVRIQINEQILYPNTTYKVFEIAKAIEYGMENFVGKSIFKNSMEEVGANL